jgi:hypothetical protein
MKIMALRVNAIISPVWATEHALLGPSLTGWDIAGRNAEVTSAHERRRRSYRKANLSRGGL